MKTNTAVFLLLLTFTATLLGQGNSIAELRRQIALGYHQVDPKTQTQARSGNPDAQALLRYQQAQSQVNGDINSGRISPESAALARQQAAMNYHAEMLRVQQERQLAELRRQTEELERIRLEFQRRNARR